MKIAIPRMGESVAPCFEYCAMMAIFTIEDGCVTDQFDFPLSSRQPFDRVRLLRDQEIDAIICGGVQGNYEEALRATGIQVFSWVSGTVDSLLHSFLHGKLVTGSEYPTQIGTGKKPTDRTEH